MGPAHDDGRSDDAYGRVSNAERYRMLHSVASRLLDDLVTQYEVTREVAPGDVVARDADRALLLTPAGGGAPVTIAFTAFPGLQVRFGEWHVEAFPTCGCDACDEQPQAVADDFTAKVAAVVHGQFRERLRRLPRPSLTFEFQPGYQGWRRLTHAEARRLGPAGVRHWQPWRLRGASGSG